MLVSLHMQKWRKHLDKVITFADGLNAVRGANENGKTSMLLAIAYALWGAKVLPLPLAEFVTWGGYTEKDVKVNCVIRQGGQLYSFTRGKSGAECTHDGGIVTGQDEVSAFASKLLGADGKRAMTLMFAPQGELRGALKAGPTAISEYIEDMSGMDLFDRLMDAIGEKLTTGPTTKLDNDVSDLEGRIESGGPVEPDLSELREKQFDLEKTYQAYQSTHNTAIDTARMANDAYTSAKAAADVRGQAMVSLNRAEVNRDRRMEQLESDQVAAGVDVDEARITQIEDILRDEQAQEATRSAYRAFLKLPTVEDEWAGDEASLKAAIASERSSIQGKQQRISSMMADIREAKAKLTTSSICGFCDQDLSQFPEVAKRNAEIEAAVALKQADITELEKDLPQQQSDYQTMCLILDTADPFHVFLRKYDAYVNTDAAFVPSKVTWKGEVPAAMTDTGGLQAEMVKLKNALTKKQAAAARISQTEADLKADHELVAELKSAVPAPVDLTELADAKKQADDSVRTWNTNLEVCRTDIHRVETAKASKWAEYELAKRAFAQNSVVLAEKRAERDTLVFNNTLVKKIKAARPVIAAELWAVVLSSVSVMFTNMRGEHSVVTKGAKGFLVNDRPSEGLSGSALDLLGFAIRVAMLKTFIPTCSFLILDEATSACDDDRTASLMGFIASAGFPQTLLVTHEAAAEAVADNVIMI